MKYPSTIIALALLLVVAPAYGQQDSNKPAVIVRFIAVAKPPRVVMTGSGDNRQGKIIDPEAIPPTDLSIDLGKKGNTPLSLMLNVPSRNFLLRSQELRVFKGSGSDEQQKAYISLSLPQANGVFTVLFSRRPGERHWNNPVVTVLKDSSSASAVGLIRMVNLSKHPIGITAGTGKKIIKSGASVQFSRADKAQWRNAVIYASIGGRWNKLRPVNGNTSPNIQQTIICYHARPDSSQISVVSCNQRLEGMSRLKSRAMIMDGEKPATPGRSQ